MITKAIVPAAGFGTRFLPVSKAVPKEMLPIVDTPVVQYVVEEAAASGITDVLFVISRTKRALEEHFDRVPELERELERKGKTVELAAVRKPAGLVRVHYTWQHEMRGLGDAVLHGRSFAGGEPFAVLLGDTILETTSDRPVLRQLLDVYEERGGSVVALEEVPMERVSRYGVIDGTLDASGVAEVRDFVEKPKPEEAPSNLVIASRYVFTPEIFGCLDETTPGKGGEIQLTDAMRRLVKRQPMFGRKVDGVRHDVGNALDFVKTNIHYALQRPEMRDKLLAYMKSLV